MIVGPPPHPQKLKNTISSVYPYYDTSHYLHFMWFSHQTSKKN